MRTLIRGALVAKSFVLGVLILTAWARSYFAGDSLMRGDDAQHVRVLSACGVVGFEFASDGGAMRLPSGWSTDGSRSPREFLRDAHFPESTATSLIQMLGFGFDRREISWPHDQMVITLFLPHWLLLVLTAPAAFGWIWRRNRRNAAAEEDPSRAGEFAWCPGCQLQYAAHASRICSCCRGKLAVRHHDDIAIA